VVAAQLLVGRQLLDLLTGSTPVDIGELGPYLVLLGGLLLIAALSQAVSNEVRVLLAEKVHRLAMDEILDVAIEVEYEAYEGAGFHDRLQRARAAAGGQSVAVVFGLVTIVSTIGVAVGVVVVLLAVVPLLVPVAVFGYLPVALVNSRNTRARYRFELELTELQRERAYLEVLMTDRTFAKELRSYGTAPTLRLWHGELWDVRIRRLQALVKQRLLRSSVGSFLTTAALVVTLSAAFILAARGSISVGDAAVAIVGLQQLSTRMHSAGTAFNGVQEGVVFLRDFEEFRSSLPDIRSRRPTRRPPAPTVLSVQDLCYRYPGADSYAVQNVSFELRRGQIMAVVGANGSGKSTLAKLLGDLLTPSGGEISWDGVDLASCDPELVRAQVAFVFQDFVPYLLTIGRAIGLGDPARLDDEDAIRNAAAQAGLGELIASLPDGLSTRLGKSFSGGIDISGGQWQRLAIARALFRDASVLLLDEPSASLDPRAEADLFKLLHTLCDDRIVVFVSHRFSTVRSADVVMVMDQGAVVEIGSHDELVEAGGLYRDLFQLQAERYG
jgi:ATP-binding cassette subfamily B protein